MNSDYDVSDDEIEVSEYVLSEEDCHDWYSEELLNDWFLIQEVTGTKRTFHQWCVFALSGPTWTSSYELQVPMYIQNLHKTIGIDWSCEDFYTFLQ